MKVPIYQIHKIIRLYIKQLTRSESAESDKKHGEEFPVDRIRIHTREERWEIINKVTADIFEKIKNYGPGDVPVREIVDRIEKEIHLIRIQQTEFVFNTINDQNEKIKNKIPVDDSRFLLGRVESLMKEAIDSEIKF
ncbi:MAG: hypothetical protein R6X10_04935 [Desulfobacterales bacterium]